MILGEFETRGACNVTSPGVLIKRGLDGSVKNQLVCEWYCRHG